MRNLRFSFLAVGLFSLGNFSFAVAQADNSLFAAWDPRSQVLDLAPDFSTDAYNFAFRWKYHPADLQISTKLAFNRKWRSPSPSEWSENPELNILKNFRLASSKWSSGVLLEAATEPKAKIKNFQGGVGPILVANQTAFDKTLSLRQKFVIEKKFFGIPEKRTTKKNLTTQYKVSLEFSYDLNDRLKLEVETGHLHSMSEDSTVRRDNEISAVQIRKVLLNRGEWVLGFLTDRIATTQDPSQLKIFDASESRGFFSVMFPL